MQFLPTTPELIGRESHTPRPDQTSRLSNDDTIRPITSPEGEKTIPTAEVQQPEPEGQKLSLLAALKRDARLAITHSWMNVLLVFVPVGIIIATIPGEETVHGGIVFGINCIAVIPLAGLLAYATESVSSELGDALGALLNVTLGNSVELIIFIALTQNKIRIVQASLLGSILANLLLILGMAFFLGGMRYREQIYNSTVTQMSACLLSLSVISLVLPTAFHASFRDAKDADEKSLKISRGTSVILLLVYIIFLIFQLKSHSYLYESMPQHIVDAEATPGPAVKWLQGEDSSGSDSDDSGRTRETYRKKMKRVMRKGRSRKASLSSDEEDESEMSRRSSFTIAVTPADGTVDEPAGIPQATSSDLHILTVEDGVAKYENRKKRRHHRRKQRRNENEDETPIMPRSDNATRPSRHSSHTRAQQLLAPGLVQDAEADGHPNNNTGRAHFDARRAYSLPNRLGGAQHPERAPGTIPLPHRASAVLTRGGAAIEQSSSGEDEEHHLSKTGAILLLAITTALVAACAEFLVSSIESVTESSSIGEIFIGLIVLPIVGNAAEHITAITVAMKNKMDLAIHVAVGSSIQVALLITPLVVILGWAMEKDMSLYFTMFETVCLFVSAFIVNFLVLDGRSNYLEGALLFAVYVIIGVVAFFYPEADEAAHWGGVNT